MIKSVLNSNKAIRCPITSTIQLTDHSLFSIYRFIIPILIFIGFRDANFTRNIYDNNSSVNTVTGAEMNVFYEFSAASGTTPPPLYVSVTAVSSMLRLVKVWDKVRT